MKSSYKIFMALFLIIAGGVVSANTQETEDRTAGLDPEKTSFGFNIDPSGFALFGPSITAELTKGNFNARLNLRFPSLGYLNSRRYYRKDIREIVYEGVRENVYDLGYIDDIFSFDLAFNYFYHTLNGGFYIGGMLGLTFGKAEWTWFRVNENNVIVAQGDDQNSGIKGGALAMSIGYTFVLPSRITFRVGGYLGWGYYPEGNNSGHIFYYKPDLTFGYSF